MTILCLGEILWDVFPDQREELGGAVFNLGFHLTRLGHDVRFLSAVGDDARGRRARQSTTKLGMATTYLQTNMTLPTGMVKVTLDAERQPSFVLERPAAYDQVALSKRDLDALAAANPDWICFGTLFFTSALNLSTLRRLLEACPKARCFYDINLRKDYWSEALVRELLPLADLVKLNEAEWHAVGPLLPASTAPVCVTRAERGCSFDGEDVPGYQVKVADAVGAGDAFSAGLLHGVNQGWTGRETADFANRVGAIVASKPGATPFWTEDELTALTR